MSPGDHILTGDVLLLTTGAYGSPGVHQRREGSTQEEQRFFHDFSAPTGSQALVISSDDVMPGWHLVLVVGRLGWVHYLDFEAFDISCSGSQ